MKKSSKHSGKFQDVLHQGLVKQFMACTTTEQADHLIREARIMNLKLFLTDDHIHTLDMIYENTLALIEIKRPKPLDLY